MEQMRPFRSSGLLWLLLALAVGCTTAAYRRSADRQTYRILAEKRPQVPNLGPRFRIEQTNILTLETLPEVKQVEPFLGSEGETEGGHLLSLEHALEIAVKHSRIYQTSKEQLYLEALGLTLDRHQFEPIFSAGARGDYRVQTEQALDVGVDPATGQPRVLLSDRLVEQSLLTGRGSAGVDWLIKTGGRISAAVTADFLRFLMGDPRTLTSSQLGVTLVQPLLRGAGYKVTMENLTQSERTVLYAMRDFAQFRKDFSVQIATAYYLVLQNRDQVRNSYLNLESSRRAAERTRALAREGRATQTDLGRLEQQELSAESAWINALRAYKQSLDNFKIQLGVSTDVKLVLDERELEQLTIIQPPVNPQDSLKIALANRLDFYNARDQKEDTQRKIQVAANRLKPDLDLIAAANFTSPQGEGTGFLLPDLNRYRWNAGLNLDLPLERKAQRNSYRAALIAHEQSARALSLKEDEIKLQVRESWRQLDQARRNYEISNVGVKLAERRVEEQELLAEVGRGRALDQVDAQNDLANARNQRTQALVAHTIARLQFWNNLGILFIKDNGQWEEGLHVQNP